MKRMKINIILFFSFSIALGAIVGFVHSASSLLEASTPSNQGTIVAPTTDPKVTEKKKEQDNPTTTNQEKMDKESQTELSQKKYKVESGQTLWEIARTSGLTVQELMNQNQLTSTVIVEGQELVIVRE